MKNKYFLLRHGQALSNVKEIISSWPEKGRFPLTEKGRKDIKERAQELKDKNVDFIFSSDLLRTKQTAQIVSEKIGIEPFFEKRLREYNVGIFNGKPEIDYRKHMEGKNRFKESSQRGETYNQIAERVLDLFKELEEKYSGKNILIISHQVPLTLLEAQIKGVSFEGKRSSWDLRDKLLGGEKIKTGELRELTEN